jgi:hypothetical protein
LGTDESIAAYRAAELRLRALLLGDGMHEAGHVRGEEARARVSAQLRRLRAAFDDVVARSAAGDARILDLEEELKARATSAARRKPAARKPTARKPRNPRTP